MWLLFDVLEYSARGLLYIYLCKGALVWKEKYERQGKYIFFLLFLAWEMWLGNSKWLQNLLYGENMEIQRSSTGIVKLFLSFIIYFILSDIFYEGSRLVKAYLLLLYETVLEITRFGVHVFWSLGINAYLEWQVQRIIHETKPLDSYELRLKLLEYVWNFSLILLYCGIAFLIIRIIRKYRRKIQIQNISRQGILFLMLSPAVGMGFDLILRCLFFTRTGAEVDFLYDRHRGMYAIVPLMTLLCLLSIIYSIKIYEELMQVQEEKNRLYFYKQQLSDMTGHVQEMERLYDGIRGMQHDMNNYIADMEQLLRAGIRGNNPDVSFEAEAHSYLEHMKNAVDTLTIKYHTGNAVTDVIINRKGQMCDKEGIGFISDFFFPEGLGIEAFDLGILLNNALDNAVEGCNRCLTKEHAVIKVRSYRKGKMFFLKIENNCNPESILYTEEKTLLTAKEDEWMHGIGQRNMKSVVEKYFGTMYHEVIDDIFILTVMLQGNISNS